MARLHCMCLQGRLALARLHCVCVCKGCWHWLGHTVYVFEREAAIG